ncbi:MAG: hypothetical protein H0U98_16430 [Alphaproteobacteria bacterium]|nr:hypothetical protein [Alphaproteobacteria bacterium]
MFQHLRAVLLATATLVGLGGGHNVSAGFHPAVALVASESKQPANAQIRLVTSASVRAIAIGY